MKWLEIKVGYESYEKILISDLVSSIFYDLGVQGVLIEDHDMKIEEYVKDKITKSSECGAVIGYLPMDKRIEQKFKLLKKRLGYLKKEAEVKLLVSCREIDEEVWSESWKAYFWPEKITKQIVVKPTWRKYVPDPRETVIEIDPGMAFGTGTHPTTRLCIILIEKYLKKGQSLLDIGTGSGILLITAAKLGAGKGLGIDQDEVAVDIGIANLRLNGINPERFKIKAGDLIEKIEDIYDVVVANILSEVILSLLLMINKVLKSHGLFICSGISVINQNTVIKKMKEMGFEIVEVRIKEEWLAIVGRLTDLSR
jgi:ribosomal protein L11 methyltransferase